MDKAVFTLIVKILGEPGYYRPPFNRPDVMVSRFRNVEAMANVDRIWAECAEWWFDHVMEITFYETKCLASLFFARPHRSPFDEHVT